MMILYTVRICNDFTYSSQSNMQYGIKNVTSDWQQKEHMRTLSAFTFLI